jgi:4-diphosphocytidyl-2-C-methyl-D-erythritol kinase
LTALAATPNCLIARMSGSGATCFGLYGDAASSRKAAQSIVERHPSWWVRAAPVLEGHAGDGVDLA